MNSAFGNVLFIGERLGKPVTYSSIYSDVEVSSWHLAAPETGTSTNMDAMLFEFLRADSPQKVLTFLEAWGAWGVSGIRYLAVRGTSTPLGRESQPAEILFLSEIRLWQEKLREALLGADEAWYRDAPSITLTSHQTFPFFAAEFSSSRQALAALVSAEKLRKNRIGVCARPGCGGVWPQTQASKRPKKYCTDKCQHNDLLRRGREAKKRLANLPKTSSIH